jgi:hypothetical protein
MEISEALAHLKLAASCAPTGIAIPIAPLQSPARNPLKSLGRSTLASWLSQTLTCTHGAVGSGRRSARPRTRASRERGSDHRHPLSAELSWLDAAHTATGTERISGRLAIVRIQLHKHSSRQTWRWCGGLQLGVQAIEGHGLVLGNVIAQLRQPRASIWVSRRPLLPRPKVCQGALARAMSSRRPHRCAP